MKPKITAFFLLITQLSSAVILNNNGKGEFHIIPLYTTSNTHNPLVTVTNDSGISTAVKIHIKASLDSLPALSYNVYLTPYDSWTFALGNSVVNNEITTIHASFDNSCTPTLNHLGTALQLSDNTPGSEQLGYIEVIEMGKAEGNQPSNLPVFPIDNPQNGTFHCQPTLNAFATNGPWDSEETYINDRLIAPDNSLLVEASILQVSDGAQYPVPVTTFADFFPDEQAFHTHPASHLPTLNDADNQAMLWIDGSPMTLTFDNGVDAINALLLKSILKAPFIIIDGIAAINSISLSLPTAPLSESVTNNEQCNTFASHDFDVRFIDRSGSTIPSLNIENLSFCGYTSVLNFNQNRTLFEAINQTPIDTSLLNTQEGVFIMTFSNPMTIEGVDTNANQAYAFQGLPVIGTTFNRATNANASPGLLAQYGTSQPVMGEPTISVVNSSKE